MPKFSIIITFINTSKLLEQCIHSFEKQSFQDFELILISENKISHEFLSKFSLKNIKTIITKFLTPGEKRHEATKYSKGKYLLFIDDDAYAQKNLLRIYHKQIDKFQHEAMGGPAIDRLDEKKNIVKALSFLFKVKFFGGFPERYSKLKYKTVDDWPSVNFLIKKETYESTKGFNHKFWPGEDSLLCNELCYKLKKKIHYIPEAIVFHKRRPSVKSHIKQIYGYSNMRGNFFAKKIENSSNKKFFIPSTFFIFNLISIFFFVVIHNKILNNFIISIFFIYFFLNFVLSLYTIFKLKEKMLLLPLFIFANYFNHLVYGLFFLNSFLKKKILSK